MSSKYIWRGGFTLIELLVVIAIIGLLSSVVISSLGVARAKARDAKRLSDLVQFEKALALYYEQNGFYPKRDTAASYAGTACPSGNPATGNPNWCSLYTDLLPYLPLPKDPGDGNVYRYYYDADNGDSYQSYGLMMRFENASNYSKVAGDGGFSGYGNTTNGSFYEVGTQPKYCQQKSPAQNWWSGITWVCTTSN